MTPKEKADELLTKYINQWFVFGDYLSIAKAKQCALILVYEVIDELKSRGILSGYWYEVYEEIEKM